MLAYYLPNKYLLTFKYFSLSVYIYIYILNERIQFRIFKQRWFYDMQLPSTRSVETRLVKSNFDTCISTRDVRCTDNFPISWRPSNPKTRYELRVCRFYRIISQREIINSHSARRYTCMQTRVCQGNLLGTEGHAPSTAKDEMYLRWEGKPRGLRSETKTNRHVLRSLIRSFVTCPRFMRVNAYTWRKRPETRS